MKKLIRSAYVPTVVAVLAIALFLRLAYVRIGAVDRYSFSIDPRLSAVVHGNIVDFVQQSMRCKNARSGELLACLREQFPCIQSVATQLVPPGMLHVEVRAVDPIFSLNKAFVMSATGSIFAKQLFQPRTLYCLTDISVHDIDLSDYVLPQTLTAFLKSMSSGLFVRYHVDWFDRTYVLLTDKKQKNFSLVCNATSVLDNRLLNFCEKIKQDLVEEGALQCGTRRHWVTDVRFQDQIVLFLKKRGVTYV